jgi:hypothetical protein
MESVSVDVVEAHKRQKNTPKQLGLIRFTVNPYGLGGTESV